MRREEGKKSEEKKKNGVPNNFQGNIFYFFFLKHKIEWDCFNSLDSAFHNLRPRNFIVSLRTLVCAKCIVHSTFSSLPVPSPIPLPGVDYKASLRALGFTLFTGTSLPSFPSSPLPFPFPSFHFSLLLPPLRARPLKYSYGSRA